MIDKNQNTDDLIAGLCDDLTPTSPRCPYRRVAVWFVGALLYLAGVVAFVGLRGDFDMQLMQSMFLFEIGLAAMILMSSALASSWLSFPDCFQRSWIKVVPITLSAAFMLWVVARTIEEGAASSFHFHLTHCAQEGIFMEVIPLIALVIITMKGHTTQPYWSMAMNVLAASTLGWIGLRLTCSMDAMGHSLFNHILPFAILAAALGFFTRKLFKW